MKPPCRPEPQSDPSSPSRVQDRPGKTGEPIGRGNWEDRQRPRSFGPSGALLFGAVCIALMWLSVLGTILSLVMQFTGRGAPWPLLSVVFLVTLFVSAVPALIISLTRKCPLCHGTPLHSRFCPKHRLANHWPPFTLRATVVLRILTTLSFRCMYCGTPFRLFKKSSRRNAEDGM